MVLLGSGTRLGVGFSEAGVGMDELVGLVGCETCGVFGLGYAAIVLDVELSFRFGG